MKSKFTLAVWAALLLIVSCKKYNHIDNSSTVKTPYTMFVGGYPGNLLVTNDALYFRGIFNTDQSSVRQIITADSNILWLKKYVYLSKDDGKSFIKVHDTPIPFYDAFYQFFTRNTMLYDESSRIVYLCTQSGLQKSTDLGETWVAEANWDDPAITPTSITELDNGDLFIMEDTAKIYRLAGGTGNWAAVNVATGINDNTGIYYLSKNGNTLVATDLMGRKGVNVSTDFGVNWTKLSGSSLTSEILFGNQPYGSKYYYVGRDSAGLFRYDGTALKLANTGIPLTAKVAYVEGKKVVYRTDIARYYLFCATDKGLYMSESDGDDWRLIYKGDFCTLY